MSEKIKLILKNITQKKVLKTLKLSNYYYPEIVIINYKYYFIFDNEYYTFEEYLGDLEKENHPYFQKVYQSLKNE